MNKEFIIAEIRRIAGTQGGKAPGKKAFENETGIKESDWFPDLWLRWSEALFEANQLPNILNQRMDDAFVLKRYIDLIGELGHVPIKGELRLKAREDKTFPSHNLFSRYGGKPGILQKVILFCEDNSGYDDILIICKNSLPASAKTVAQDVRIDVKVATGFVYLMQSGKHYKIGRTDFPVGHREYQLGIILPIPPKTLHYIETDDPVGVEQYWHNRFRDKRRDGHGSRKGEWFDLTADDVRAFKRWKRIV